MQRSNPVQTFEAFFAEWLVRQENLLNELGDTTHNPNPKHTIEESEAQMNELVTRVSAHYHEYFTAKSRLAQHNIIILFYPTWFTPLEKTFLWIAGFKPGLAFQLVKKFILDLDNNQLSEIEQARTESKLEERDLMEEQTRIQEMIAAPPMMEIVRRAADTAVDGEVAELESATEELKYAMEELECADFLRLKTVMRIMEILKASQNVTFFTAIARFQLQVRRWGLELQAAADSSEFEASQNLRNYPLEPFV